MYEYRVFYATEYARDNYKRAWAERPEGLIRAHLGLRNRVTDSGTLVVPVVAICERGGQTVREVHNVYIPADTAKKHSPRLRRVLVSDD